MNLEKIRSALMFIIVITITITGSESQNNFNISNDFRLSMNYTIPMHYNIKLEFLNTKMGDSKPSFIMDKYNYFYGTSIITINIFQPTRNITLYTINLNFTDKAKLIKRDGLIYKSKYNTSKTNSLVLSFDDTLFPGLYNLKLEFYGQISHNNSEGLFSTFHVNKHESSTAWMVATHIQTIGARRIFPCWDDPQIRATFDISVQHPNDSVALSNMPTQLYDMTDDTHTISYFFTTPPLSTYHIAIVVTNYNNIRINRGDVSLWCRECNRENTFEFTKEVIENVTSHLKSEFEDFVIRKVDHVAIPNFPEHSTSKWGLIFYREENLIYNEYQDPIMRKIEIARLIAHKIAYQWLGNAVSSSRWYYSWLHDGLATLFGDEAVVKALNNSEILDFFIVQNQYEALNLDYHFKMNPPLTNNLSKTNSLFSFPCCIKVPIILRMLQNAMTDLVFRRGVHAYLDMYMFKSTTFYEFWLIQVATAKTYGYNVTDKFLYWILYEHYPFLMWIQENVFYGELKQYTDFSTSGYGNWSMHIDIIVRSPSGENYKTNGTLERPASNFTHAIRGDWIIIDNQKAGYYRVEYTSKNWHKIVHYLNSSEYKSVSVVNRAKIIDDACYFTIARQYNIKHAMDIRTFWNLTNYLRQEINYVAWYPMFKMFEYLSTLIPFSEHTISTVIKRKLKELLVGPFEILNSEYLLKDDLTICLKQEIVKWACMLRHDPCLEMAQKELLMYYKKPSIILSADWREWAFCKGLLKANTSVWNIVKTRWLLYDQYELLPYLACNRDPSNIVYIPFMLWNSATHKTQDTAIIRSYINIFHTFVAKHANNYDILMNILMNLERMKPKEISTIVALANIINYVYSEKHLDEINSQLKKQKYITDKQQLSIIQQKTRTRLFEITDQINNFQFLF